MLGKYESTIRGGCYAHALLSPDDKTEDKTGEELALFVKAGIRVGAKVLAADLPRAAGGREGRHAAGRRAEPAGRAEPARLALGRVEVLRGRGASPPRSPRGAAPSFLPRRGIDVF